MGCEYHYCKANKSCLFADLEDDPSRTSTEIDTGTEDSNASSIPVYQLRPVTVIETSVTVPVDMPSTSSSESKSKTVKRKVTPNSINKEVQSRKRKKAEKIISSSKKKLQTVKGLGKRKPPVFASKQDNPAFLKTVVKWRKTIAPWLEFEVAENRSDVVSKVWCKVCRTYARGGEQILPYVKGTTNVKKQPIIKHLKSDLHKDSEGRAKVQDKIQANELTEIPKGLEKMDKKTQLKMIIIIIMIILPSTYHFLKGHSLILQTWSIYKR